MQNDGDELIDEEAAGHDEVEEQKRRLEGITTWAQRIRDHLQDILVENGHRVHFRPASTGFAMIGLLADAPQLGKGALRNPERLAATFDESFERWCASRELGRPTPEKRLQSFLIRDAQTHDGRMAVLNDAAGDGTALHFVTDEVALPARKRKIVCDLLAVRRTRDGWIPVVIELKTERTLTRLVAQLSGFAEVVDSHSELFARLASVRLGQEIRFDGGCEKWMVWPQLTGGGPEPREAQLAAEGIRVVGYRDAGDAGWRFNVGRAVVGTG